MSFFVTEAFAAEGPASAGPDGTFNIIMLVGFVVIFYFLILRPQNKRAKEHKDLVGNLAKGDEILTTGGLIGKITKVGEEDDYLMFEVANNVDLRLQKTAVAATLPKGTIKSI